MKTLLFLAASLLYSSQGCLKMDLVLLGDLSGSCQGKEKYIGDAFISIIEKLEMGEENVKISVVTFNGWSKVHVGLVGEKSKALQAAFSVKTTPANFSTAIWTGLEEALTQLYSDKARNVRKMIVIVTDAQDDNFEATRREVAKIKGLGVTLIGVLIENNATTEDFMKEICSYYIKSDYEQLAENIKQLDTCF